MTEVLVSTEEPQRHRRRVNFRVLVVRFILDLVLITIVLAFMPGFRTGLTFTLGSMALLAVIYGLLNAFVRPVLDLLLMPFVVQTYGFVVVIVDIVVFGLLVLFSG